MSGKRPIITGLAKAAYPILGDCLRHTLDVIARFQDQAGGTLLFLALEKLRHEVKAVQIGDGMDALGRERLKDQT